MPAQWQGQTREQPDCKPFSTLNSEEILQVGVRLGRVNLPTEGKTPVLEQEKHHIQCTKLLVVYHYKSIHHHGRHLTEGSTRRAGY